MKPAASLPLDVIQDATPQGSVILASARRVLRGLGKAESNNISVEDAAVVRPMFGERANLTEAEWLSIESRLSPHETWMAGKAGGAVEKAGLVRIREILSSNAKEAIAALIAKDKALEGEFNAIADLEKLIRYYRGLHQLCTNFANFRGFYGSGREGAIFQVGTLYLDQRACRLCLPVEDAARHAALAGMAGAYLAYCDCVRKGSGDKMQIVAAFTNGDSDHLMVGRNGVVYDRRRRDWDATITKIVENPISLRQAF